MEAFQQTAAVAGVLLLLAVTLWWLQRRGIARIPARARTGRRMENLERLPLAPQHALHLVRVGGRVLLIGVSPSGCSMLQEVPEADVRASIPGERP
jgi:flagellar biosynthetic protein FliO